MYFKYVILALLLGGAVWAAPRQVSHWGTAPANSELRHKLRTAPRSLDEDSLHRYDVLKIEPHLRVDLDGTTLSGYTLSELVASQIPLSQVDLRFTHSLTIDSVWADGGHQATLTSLGTDSIQVHLQPAPALHDTVRIGIAYHGNPATIDGWGGYRWGQAAGWQPQIAFSMGDGLNLDPPPANYNWIPSYADPTDKTLWEAWFRVPSNRVVSSNGLRIDTLNNNDGTTTWHYRLDQPVSTYLLSIAVSDYMIMVQRESNPLIENFVYPSRITQAQTHFANVPTVLDSFTARFGPYPFQRFGYTMTRIGDMEHATSVYHADFTVVGNHNWDWLLCHEMSHQWWGDWVTCGDWRDLWLNEGFATYCEALSMEALYGRDGYQNRVETDLFPTALGTNENFPIYDPDYYWGATVYEKGACVMHMLRQLLGDSAFFQAWREYGQEHAFGNAITADWQHKLEEHYGSSLQWFFDEWVYTGTRYPQYRVELRSTDVGEVDLRLMQQQSTGTLFRMPMDVQFVNRAGDTSRIVLWTDAISDQIWRLGPSDSTFRPWPRSVTIDPDEKMLKTVTYADYLSVEPSTPVLPRTFAISFVSPNPFNSTAIIRFELPKSSPVRLRVFDILGRELMSRNLGTMIAGRHEISWDGSNAASGVYLFRLEIHNESRVAKAVLLK